ncbi:MAG: diacylglycerol kinase family protein [Chitinophagales bacterium]|nr:diacylglycerol kinase family protein [Chitinophagales bacterium]MDW8428577.1 diacylglycerol kinase family protein [Chitinophagales bacterium]
MALAGLVAAWRTELSLRVEAAIAVVVIGLGWWLEVSRTDWLWIVAAIAWVFICEYVNTALERLVDTVSPGYSAQAGHIKDVASAAVLIAAAAAALIGLLVFVPYLQKI